MSQPFPPTALGCRHAQTVRDSTSSYKIELSKSRRASKSHQWFKSYGHFTEGVDFASWWSFIGGGSVPAACAAGLFSYCHPYCCSVKEIKYSVSRHGSFKALYNIINILMSLKAETSLKLINTCLVPDFSHFFQA